MSHRPGVRRAPRPVRWPLRSQRSARPAGSGRSWRRGGVDSQGVDRRSPGGPGQRAGCGTGPASVDGRPGPLTGHRRAGPLTGLRQPGPLTGHRQPGPLTGLRQPVGDRPGYLLRPAPIVRCQGHRGPIGDAVSGRVVRRTGLASGCDRRARRPGVIRVIRARTRTTRLGTAGRLIGRLDTGTRIRTASRAEAVGVVAGGARCRRVVTGRVRRGSGRQRTDRVRCLESGRCGWPDRTGRARRDRRGRGHRHRPQRGPGHRAGGLPPARWWLRGDTGGSRVVEPAPGRLTRCAPARRIGRAARLITGSHRTADGDGCPVGLAASGVNAVRRPADLPLTGAWGGLLGGSRIPDDANIRRGGTGAVATGEGQHFGVPGRRLRPAPTRCRVSSRRPRRIGRIAAGLTGRLPARPRSVQRRPAVGYLAARPLRTCPAVVLPRCAAAGFP